MQLLWLEHSTSRLLKNLQSDALPDELKLLLLKLEKHHRSPYLYDCTNLEIKNLMNPVTRTADEPILTVQKGGTTTEPIHSLMPRWATKK